MTERVIAELRRPAGYTGRSLHVVLDSEEMPTDQAEDLLRLVHAIDLTRLGVKLPAASGADLMRYDVAVEHAGRHWRGTAYEPYVPGELRPLLRFLVDSASALPGRR
ncbi:MULTISPECIES: protealysin inhibitor emfourin [Actinoplanes]|uniref:Uncharacterized protein n=2 Tax=Actinoplanes TaxID=1865 RepID=A0A0X3V2U9_9ACTN|nr:MULTISPECIES: protealysin inhibitor emfourin [Actinoplanes]KUL39103.1 hypothetical protein ADL15_10185 [Actinoplanes awajinensis subsp. mycoplanecinus]GIE69689.1 hypothetical protein Apa02nite_057970 [Actinoplanes palleronii]